MSSIERHDQGHRMSGAVVHRGVAYLSGQVGQNRLGDSVTVQTGDILAKIDALLCKAGTDKSRLLSASIWLSDIATFSEMNAVWDAWLSGVGAPARATVEAQLAGAQYNVEIAVTAAVD